MKNLVPLALLIGGTLAALYCVAMNTFDGDGYVILFAIASLVAVAGWNELVATDGVFETEQGE